MRKHPRLSFSAAMAAMAATMALSAQAAPVTYFGVDLNAGTSVPVGGNAQTARNQFLGTLQSVGNESFESLPLNTAAPIVLSFPGSSGNLTATMTATGGTVIVTNQNPAGQFSTSGTQHLDAGFGSTLNIDFSATPIAAFGFYGTDIADSGGDLVVVLTDVNGVVTQFTPITNNNANNSNVVFWGFTDTVTSYTNVVIRNTASTDRFGFDDMVIGDTAQVRPAPEPASFGLVGLALAGLAFTRKRKA